MSDRLTYRGPFGTDGQPGACPVEGASRARRDDSAPRFGHRPLRREDPARQARLRAANDRMSRWRRERQSRAYWLPSGSSIAGPVLLTLGFGGLVLFLEFGAIDCGSPIQESRIEIGQLSNMVDAYYLSSSPKALPLQLDELSRGPSPLTERVPQDPWGHDYVYEVWGPRDFEIYSAGPDGKRHTADDIHAMDEVEP